MRIKYIDLNVWLGGMLFENIVDYLKKEQPDILAIQEVHNETDPKLEKRYRTISELQKELPLTFASFSPALLCMEKNGLKSEQGNAILSKFPIKFIKATFYDEQYKVVHAGVRSEWPHYPRLLQYVTIDANGKTLNVFNTHGIWGEDGNDSPGRLAMSRMIIDHVKDMPYTILSGDFNVNDYTQSIKNIKKVLKNVFEGELVTSFNMKHKEKASGYATSVVDHIFVSSDIKVINHYLPDADVSDHMPLAALLDIPD